MKILTVGDVHAVIPELQDCHALIDLIEKTAIEQKVDQVLFLGDLYHNHRVIASEILYFWHTVFERFKASKLNVASMVGNHDKSAENADPKVHALVAHKQQIHVIEEPYTDTGILYLPYYSDKQAFIDDAKAASKGTNTLICHNSFEGSKFNDGYFDPEGVDPVFIKQEKVIAGHVHLPFEFGKITHIGAPRWRTLTDANTDRNIVLYEFDSNGNILNRTNFSTNEVCRQIKHVIDTEEAPFDLNLFDPKHDFRIDLKGSESYIEKRKKELQRPGLKIRTLKIGQTKVQVRESDGIKVAYHKFAARYTPKFGTPNDKLINLSNERLGFVNAD